MALCYKVVLLCVQMTLLDPIQSQQLNEYNDSVFRRNKNKTQKKLAADIF